MKDLSLITKSADETRDLGSKIGKYSEAGMVILLDGDLGAGKSTLLNALLGHEALETGEVRESDKAGRHTTVARRMVALPDAGVIVDEPGLRSLPIVGHERGLQKIFDSKLCSRLRKSMFELPTVEMLSSQTRNLEWLNPSS